MKHDEHIRILWLWIAQILDLVVQAKDLKKQPMYKNTLETILEQIYQCVLFLRWYGERGFTGKLHLCMSCVRFGVHT